MADFLYCYEDDTPTLALYLTEDGTAIDVTDCTVTIDCAGLSISGGSCAIINGTAGLVSYQLGTSVAVAGEHVVTVTIDDGTEVRTSPTPKELKLIVKEK